MNQNIVQGTSIHEYVATEIAQLGINQDQYTKYVQQALLYDKNREE